MHIDGKRRRTAALGQPFLGLDPFQQAGAHAAQLFGDGQYAVAGLFQPLVVLIRKRAFFIVLGRARGKVVGQGGREVYEALFPLGVELLHAPPPVFLALSLIILCEPG